MNEGHGSDGADGGSRWPTQLPAQHTPSRTRGQDGQRSAWDEPGWWRDMATATGGAPPHSRHRSRRKRPRRKRALAGGIGVAGVVGLATVLILTDVFGLTKAAPTPGFHPTATKPAQAARQMAEVFLAAWKKGHLQKAANYTNHPAAAAAALTSYADGLHLRALRLAVQNATAHGIVTFSVDATVGSPSTASSSPAGQSASTQSGPASNTALTATWSYTSHLTAYEKRGGWWVRWNPALIAPNLTASEKVVTVSVAPSAGEVVDAAGGNLQDLSDPGLRNIAAVLRTRAPAGQGTPGIAVELVGADNTPIASTADVVRKPVDVPVVRTTIVPNVEAAARSAVQAHPNSSMVVIRPSTGEILAVANNDGLNDFALTARVAPGSTNKIITSTALFTTGLVSSPSQPVQCPVQIVINGNTFKNDKGMSEPAGTPFLTDFAASCNNAFARWYTTIGSRTLAQTARKYYGLNQPWNIGIGSGGTYYSIPSAAFTGELAQELFGQGQLATAPLGMASVAATVDTGSFRQPIIVPGQAQLRATPLPANVHQYLWQMMRAVTQSGGTAAGVFDSVGSPVYAKTGTADVQKQGKPNSWMVAFDPTLNVAVGCLVLNAGFGASFAGPEAATALKLLATGG